MRTNKELTAFDRLRMAIGTLLSLAGVVTFVFAAAFSFTSISLTIASILLIMSGILIAGSRRLAELVSELLAG